MKKKILYIFLILVLTSISIVSAIEIYETISVIRNDIKIQLNGNEVTAENFIFEDKTYVPLRNISEMYDMQVDWANNQIAIKQKDTLNCSDKLKKIDSPFSQEELAKR